MGKKKKKKVQKRPESQPVVRAPEPGPEPPEEIGDVDDVYLDMRDSGEPDPREVESVTDRIFSSVLSRYGWSKENGKLEHLGSRR